MINSLNGRTGREIAPATADGPGTGISPVRPLAPGVPVRHANPELAAWHGTVLVDDDNDSWHKGSDVHVTWQPGETGRTRAGWYSGTVIIPDDEPEGPVAA